MLVDYDHTFTIDWHRNVRTDGEALFCETACAAVLDFMMGMKSVADTLRSKKRQAALEAAVSVVVLNALDAYVVGTSLVMGGDAPHDPDLVTKATNALHHCNLIGIASSDGNLFVDLAGALLDQAHKLKAEQLDHSQPLDVHRWSEHPESNTFVNAIYDQYFEGGNAGIRKKPLKVVLLDLYVRWSIDPIMKTAMSFNVNSYKARSRYNAIFLSPITIEIVKRLIEVGLLFVVKGFNDHNNPENNRDSRIWPTDKLISLFAEARFGLLDIGKHPDTEVIIKRDANKKDVEYTDDDTTNGMRDRLRAYNDLINRTFVDIPTLETSFIELENGHRLNVSQSDKFTRRIFNRESFEKGGRFYGGWWQRCAEQARTGIFLNDQPTLEVDYSGLHMVMLYANKSIDYWEEIGTDPYALEVAGFGPEESRAICKQLVLVALNAKDEIATFQAFRSEAENGSREKGISNGILLSVLNDLREKHVAIADYFANDAGIDLMNQDGQITDKILTAFTEAGIPILSIHDSYIVPVDHWKKLNVEMNRAFAEVTGQAGVKVEPSRDLHPGNTALGAVARIPPRLALNENGELWPELGWQDGNDLLFPWANPKPSTRYAYELKAFKSYRASAGNELGRSGATVDTIHK